MSAAPTASGATADVVIVGAGQAAAELAIRSRQLGHTGTIRIVGSEPYLPYQRPPLSKGYLEGTTTDDALNVRKAELYERLNVEVVTNTTALEIDEPAGVLKTSGGDLRFDSLVLATGGSPRKLAVAGSKAPNIRYLRTKDDSDRLRGSLVPGKRLLVVGGGYIGLEVATAARAHRMEVTVVEATDRLLHRVASVPVSDFYKQWHQGLGVHIETNVVVTGFELDGVTGLAQTALLSDGRALPFDEAVVGIGLIANTELATSAGISVSDGFLVDEYSRTNRERIHAIGDCATHLDLLGAGRRRVESVANAQEQGRVVATAIVGSPEPYSAIPWFWSDQGKIRLQSAGLPDPADEQVLLGNPGDAQFSVLHLRDDLLTGIECINSPRDFVQLKAKIGTTAPLTLDRADSSP